MTAQSFIIMQIGDADLDKVCKNAIVPALEAAGLRPSRVDKHNQGGLLKSEIIRFIQEADIIVADLTNERPNCYLEVGYAMGIDKFKNLILTAREDHQPDRPGRKPKDPKVHFDLAGYDILYWRPDDIQNLRTELEKRVRRRLAVITSTDSNTAVFTWDEPWFDAHRTAGMAGIAKVEISGYIELRASLFPKQINKSQNELLLAARDAQINTFGWPIGIVLNRPEYSPKPMADGIVAEINSSGVDRKSYDYWSLRRNGDFFLLKSLFEDSRPSGKPAIFFNTRIVRITEALLYLMRLYTRLGADPTCILHVRLRHCGLKGRVMSATSNRFINRDGVAHEDMVDSEIHASLSDIEAKLPEYVKTLLAPTFILFDYFSIGDQMYADIVNNFVEGRVT